MPECGRRPRRGFRGQESSLAQFLHLPCSICIRSKTRRFVPSAQGDSQIHIFQQISGARTVVPTLERSLHTYGPVSLERVGKQRRIGKGEGE